MDPNSRLRHEQRDLLSGNADLTAASRTGALDFDTPEELLRHDRSQTPVPPTVAQRLEASLQSSLDDLHAPAPVPWWKRWLGGGQG